jgi:hypothetical protein
MFCPAGIDAAAFIKAISTVWVSASLSTGLFIFRGRIIVFGFSIA